MEPNADISLSIEQGLEAKKPASSTRSYEDAKEAVRTMLIWLGEDPTREGLLDTPDRVARAWSEYCQGYKLDPNTLLQTCFSEINGYDEPVCMRDIEFVILHKPIQLRQTDNRRGMKINFTFQCDLMFLWVQDA